MGTKKTTTVEETELPEKAESIEIGNELEKEESEIDALEGMVSEFAGAADVVVNVYRQGDARNISFLFRTYPSEMTGGEIMERCRDQYGTGDYRVHVRQGRHIVANRPFSVEAMPKPDKDENGGRDNSTSTMLAFVTQQMQNQQAMFSETMKAMAEAFKGQQAPAFNPAEAHKAAVETLATLKKMSDPPANDNKGAVEMLIQGINLARDLAPREGESNSTDVLLKAMETFGAPLVNAAARGGVKKLPENASLLTPPERQDPQAKADAEREQQMNVRQMMLKRQLGFLVENAKQNKNPELYAELLLDQLGDQAVLDFIGQQDAMQKLIALNPEVSKYQAWFESLKKAILELTTETGDTDPTQAVVVPGLEQGAVSNVADSSNATGAPAGASGDAKNPEIDA